MEKEDWHNILQNPRSRRDVLRMLGGIAGAGLALDACSSVTSNPPPSPSPFTGKGSLNTIEHILIAVQENRTFDEYFGFYPHAGKFGVPSGYAQPDGKGGLVAPQHFKTHITGNPNHTWQAIHSEWDSGKMDGFYITNGKTALGYYDKSDLPYYYALADNFTLCGNYFCYQLGPTLPNRLLCGQEHPAALPFILAFHAQAWISRRLLTCSTPIISVGNVIIWEQAWAAYPKWSSSTLCPFLRSGRTTGGSRIHRPITSTM